MEVRAELTLQEESESRASERYETRLDAGVRKLGTTRVPATVTDLSASGFRVQCEERLQPDSVVWVKLGSLAPLMARVVWSDRLVAGCTFAAPLHPSVMDKLLGEAATQQPH